MQKMENKENLLEVLKTVFRWKKAILTVCGIAFIGSIIISLFLSDYYQSTTLFYAASEDLAKPAAVGTDLLNRNYYGTEPDIDRIMTIAESNEVADFLIKKFDLYKHYEIDTTHIKAPFFVKRTFFKHYEVIKTKFDAIELSVEDKDKKLASAMANAARDKISEIAQNLVKAGQNQEIRDKKKSIEEKERNLIELGDSLRVLRSEYGIYSYTQSETLTELLATSGAKLAREKARKSSLESSSSVPRDTIVYVAALVNGLEKEIENITNQIEQINNGMSQVDGLERTRQEATDQLSLDKERYKQLQSAYQSDFTALILVEKAATPIVKSRPKRTYIVIGAVLVAFLFSIIGVLIMDMYRDVNWSEIVNAK